MAAAPRDKQAWRLTKEHIRPRFLESQNGILANLIGAGKNTESEIDLGNHSKYLAGGAKPITPDQLMSLFIREPYSTDLTGITKSLGVDWGNETRWVMLGQRPDGRLIVLDSGVFGDADTLKHVDAISTMIARELPAWTVCDSGYGKTRNQILMRAFPGRVWSCFSNSTSTFSPLLPNCY